MVSGDNFPHDWVHATSVLLKVISGVRRIPEQSTNLMNSQMVIYIDDTRCNSCQTDLEERHEFLLKSIKAKMEQNIAPQTPQV